MGRQNHHLTSLHSQAPITLHQREPLKTVHKPRTTPPIPINPYILDNMYRQSIVKAVRPALRSILESRAAFTTTSRAMAGGDTGAPRSGGIVQEYVAQFPCFPHQAMSGKLMLIDQFQQRCLYQARESPGRLRHPHAREGETLGAQEEARRAARTSQEARGTHVCRNPQTRPVSPHRRLPLSLDVSRWNEYVTDEPCTIVTRSRRTLAVSRSKYSFDTRESVW
jgi:hypothetical protein